jgi:hypothetical protein
MAIESVCLTIGILMYPLAILPGGFYGFGAITLVAGILVSILALRNARYRRCPGCERVYSIVKERAFICKHCNVSYVIGGPRLDGQTGDQLVRARLTHSNRVGRFFLLTAFVAGVGGFGLAEESYSLFARISAQEAKGRSTGADWHHSARMEDFYSDLITSVSSFGCSIVMLYLYTAHKRQARILKKMHTIVVQSNGHGKVINYTGISNQDGDGKKVRISEVRNEPDADLRDTSEMPLPLPFDVKEKDV